MRHGKGGKGCAGLLLFLLLLGMLGLARAAAPEIRFCWTVDGSEVSVTMQEKKGRIWNLYLPGALAGQEPVIRVDQDVDVIWDGRTYASGSTLPLSQYIGKEAEVSFSNNRPVGTVRVMQGSAIPSLYFTVDPDDFRRVNQSTKGDIRKEASFVMISGKGRLNAAERLTSFKTRGNSTFFASKKAFQFRMENKVNLDGMGKGKTWILLANWFDISLIRNQITFDLCREIGLRGTPDCRQVDLYLNGSYNGTYLLCEKIQLKSGRLDITDMEEELEALNGGKEAVEKVPLRKATRVARIIKWFDVKNEPADVTGGYLLEIEKALQFSLMKNDAGFVTEQGMCVVVKEPTKCGYEEMKYIAALVNDFDNAVVAKSGVSKKTGRSYSSYIDMRSFALKVTIEELTANYDVRAASQFLYKDSDKVDGRLYAGPAWDYDLAFGNKKGDGMLNPLRKNYVYRRSSNTAYLYHYLLIHEDFQMITRQLYDEVFLPAVEVLLGKREPAAGSGLKSIERYRAEISDSAAMNFVRWSAPSIPDVDARSGLTFDDAVDYVKNWVEVRSGMMTECWLLEPQNSK